MHKPTILINKCVKTVNNLRLLGGETGDDSSTFLNNQFNISIKKGVRTKLFDNSIQLKSTDFYTHLNSKFNLLGKTFTYNPQPLLMRLWKEI